MLIMPEYKINEYQNRAGRSGGKEEVLWWDDREVRNKEEKQKLTLSIRKSHSGFKRGGSLAYKIEFALWSSANKNYKDISYATI